MALFVASLTMLGTLVTCQAAFVSSRQFVPRQCIFSERLVLSSSLATKLWIAAVVCCILACLSGAAFFFWPIALWCVTMFVLDRFIASPQLFHFFVACLAILSGKLWLLQLFAVCLYLFGGLQKLNPFFLRSFVPNFLGRAVRIKKLDRRVPLFAQRALGLGAAISEASLGVALMLYGHSAGYLVALLHVAILVSVSRWKFRGIWGWNVFCFFCALWIYEDGPLWHKLPEAPLLASLILLAFFVAPACNMLFGHFEEFSLKLHSSNNNRYAWLVPEGTCCPREFEMYMTESEDVPGYAELDLADYMVDSAYLMSALSDRTAGSLARNLLRQLQAKSVLLYSRRLKDGSLKDKIASVHSESEFVMA